jgi:hydrogenase nickel incorporation protein HypA/HybF
MHELSLAHSIGEIALSALREQPPGEDWRVGAIRLRVGDLAAVDPEALAFCFEVVRCEWPEMSGASLTIERCPARARCEGCGESYGLTAEVEGCTSCGGSGRVLLSGRELEVFGVELLA